MHHLYEIGCGFAAGIVVSKLYFARVVADLKRAAALAKQYVQQ